MTLRGVTVAVVSAFAYICGVVLHYPELGVIGVAGALVVLVGACWVVRAPRLDVERTIEPSRVTRGEVALGLLKVKNPGRTTAAATRAIESFGETRLGVEIPRLASGETTRTTYRLPTDERRVVDVGPLSVGREDPFGLWRTSRVVGSVERLFVHPVTHALSGVPSGKSRSIDGADSNRLPQGGIAFQSLREYVWGDDLRHVHWRSSARLGTLMVRENVDTSTPRVTVLLDTIARSYRAADFEESVEVAASVAVAMTRAGYPVRVVTSGGRSVSGRGLGGDSQAILDLLSEIVLLDEGSLMDIVPSLLHERSRDVLVGITGQASEPDLVSLAALAGRFEQGVIAIVGADSSLVSCPASASTLVLRGDSSKDIANAWNRALVP